MRSSHFNSFVFISYSLSVVDPYEKNGSLPHHGSATHSAIFFHYFLHGSKALNLIRVYLFDMP